MTPDEIVKALHGYAKNAQENFEVDTMRDFDSAADLIESMQSQLADYHHMSELVDGKMEENQRLRKMVDKLQANLAESQRRERAVVEDIHEIDRFNGKCFRCKSWNGVRCKRGYSVNASFCNDWQWRGPQEAGEGEAE